MMFPKTLRSVFFADFYCKPEPLCLREIARLPLFGIVDPITVVEIEVENYLEFYDV